MQIFNKNSVSMLWQELRNALKGTEADYTSINLNKAIFLLAVPMILELIMESTFAVADIYFVGRLGASAVATVGLTETFLFLIYALAMGLSVAVTATIARRIGEKNKEEAASTGLQAIILAFLFSLPFSFAGIYFASDLLRLMGADAWALTEGVAYTRWMLGGNLVILFLFVINAIFRGAGDAASAMKILLLANTLNIILDPILIYGLGPFPQMGIEGAAIATNIGRGVGVIFQFYLLFKGGPHIQIRKSNLKLNLKLLSNLLKTSLGGIAQMLISMTSWIFLMRILSSIGSTAVAGATITIRIIMFTLMPAWGFSNAAATLVGQNLGAGNPQRAENTVWKIGLYNMYFLIAVSILFFLFPKELVGIFTNDEEVVRVGAKWLSILSYSYFIYGWWMVTVQAFNGAGDTRTPTYINLVFFWAIQIPLSYLLAVHGNWGASGVFWGVFISETSVGLFTLWLFSRGQWKKTKL